MSNDLEGEGTVVITKTVRSSSLLIAATGQIPRPNPTDIAATISSMKRASFAVYNDALGAGATFRRINEPSKYIEHGIAGAVQSILQMPVGRR